MRYNQAVSTYQIFKAYWNTETINGVEVYVEHMVFYANRFMQDTKLKKFVKSLGMEWEDFINQDIDSEIETMYFYLKGGYVWTGKKAWTDFGIDVTPTTPYGAPTRQQIADRINAEYKVGDELKATVSYGGELGRYITEHDLTWIATGTNIEIQPFDKNIVRATIHSNPWYYLVNSRHMTYTKDSYPYQLYEGNNTTLETFYQPTDRKIPPCGVYAEGSKFGVLALLGDETAFRLEKDSNGDVVIYDEKVTTNTTADGEVLRYRYSMSYTFMGVDEYSSVVQDIHEWYKYYYDNFDDIKYEPREPDRYKEELTSTMIDTRYKHLFVDMMVDPQTINNTTVVEDNLYIKIPHDDGMGGYDYTSHLKVDAVASMKKADFVKMLSKQIDVDYTVEKKKWWESLLLVVIIIIAVAISYFSAGALATTSMGFVATFAGTLAITLSIGGMIMAELGGLSAQSYVKVIGKFAQISGYVAMVAGITAAYQSFVSNVAKESLTQAGMEVTKESLAKAVADVTVSDMVSFAMDAVKDSISNMFTSASQTSVMDVVSYVGDGIKMLKQVNDYMVDKEMEELKEESDKLAKEEAEWNESLSSNVFKNGSVTLSMEMSRISEYDAISLIDLQKFNDSATSFKTENSRNWAIGLENA